MDPTADGIDYAADSSVKNGRNRSAILSVSGSANSETFPHSVPPPGNVPATWKWTWAMACPAAMPLFCQTAMPTLRYARSIARADLRTAIASCDASCAVTSRIVATCRFGTTSKCGIPRCSLVTITEESASFQRNVYGRSPRMYAQNAHGNSCGMRILCSAVTKASAKKETTGAPFCPIYRNLWDGPRSATPRRLYSVWRRT